jgi:hypothetical protein
MVDAAAWLNACGLARAREGAKQFRGSEAELLTAKKKKKGRSGEIGGATNSGELRRTPAWSALPKAGLTLA